jgi:hypothetical protein
MVRRDSKPHTVSRSITLRVNNGQRRYANEVALHIDKCSLAISWLNRRICLDGVGDDRSSRLLHAASQSTDNSIGHRLCNAQRVANGQGIVSFLFLFLRQYSDENTGVRRE